MINKRLIQDLKNAWRNTNTATLGFAENVPTTEWFSKPFEPRFRSIAWEFACLTRVRYVRLKAIRTGVFQTGHHEDIPDKDLLAKMDKVEIINRLESLSRELLAEIEKLQKDNQVKMVLWLLQHERLHHGKLMLYFSKAEYKFPKSFVKTWGEWNFKKG